MEDFLKGTLFMALCVPIFNSIVSLCSQFTEYLCTKIAVKTYTLEQSIQEPEEKPSAIGFDLSGVDYDEEDDYEEEE